MSVRARHKLRNIVHSAMLILGMALVVGACAWALWGQEGVLWSIAGIALAAVLAPSVPVSLILALHRAQSIPRIEAPELYTAVGKLTRQAGLPSAPRLYYIPSATLNAFAVGPRHAAAIAVTDGMLRKLSFRELVNVLAHEVSHIANGDLWIMGLADIMSRFATLMSYLGMFFLLLNMPLIMVGAVVVPWPFVLVLLVAPPLMSLFQLALSRAREFDADLGAVNLTGDPDGLATALAKLERSQGWHWESVLFPGRRTPDPSLLRTHPPTDERIRRISDLRPRSPEGSRFRAAPHILIFPARRMPVRTPPRYRWSGYW